MLVLLALIPLRAVLAEVRTFEILGWFAGESSAPATAMPGTTFAIITVIVGVALAVVTARLLFGGAKYRWTGLEIGAGVLVIAGVISTSYAGQKHLAIIGVLDILGLILYCITLRQLLRRPWQIRLALTVILATGAMTIAKCGYQKWVEMPATAEHYEVHKAELLNDGNPPSEGLLHDFEQRLRSNSLSSYFGHPNVLGSYLILVITTALALAVGRWRRLAPGSSRRVGMLVAPFLIAISGVAALIGTQSKGACAACGVALLFWLVCHLIRRHGPQFVIRRAWMVLCVLTILGGLAVVGTLKARPDALGRSMLFRTLYWQGAADMVYDQGPQGVGAGNFGRHFTKYKPIACPEDVDSPHSWIVSFATEWGYLGLAGFLLVLLSVSRRLMRRLVRPLPGLGGDMLLGESSLSPTVLAPTIFAGRYVIHWAAGVGAFAFGWWMLVIVDSEPFYVAETILVAASAWLVAFIAVAIESAESRQFDDSIPGPLLLGICSGLFGFLLHSGVDLAIFNAGAATLFFALVATSLAIHGLKKDVADSSGAPDVEASSAGWNRVDGRRPNLAAVCLTTVLGLGVIGALVIVLIVPTVKLGGHLTIARRDIAAAGDAGNVPVRAYRAYRDATDCYPLDSTAIGELIEEGIPRISSIEEADALLGLATTFRGRDPDNGMGWSYLAGIHTFRFGHGGRTDDLKKAVSAMRERVDCYPASPRHRIALARVLELLGNATSSPHEYRIAADELQTALDLDAQRVYVSKPNRLTEGARAAIARDIKRLSDSSGD